MKRWVTHFVRCPPEPDGWIEVGFLTQTEGEELFWGVDNEHPIPATEIDERVKEGEVEALGNPTLLEREQSVWLSPQGDVWIADNANPISDETRVLVGKAVCPPASPEPDQSVVERIIARKDDGEGAAANLYWIDKCYVPGSSYRDFAYGVMTESARELAASPLEMPSDTIQWDNIPHEIANGSIDFCCDPYFLTRVRAASSDVVHIGWIEDITLYVEQSSRLFELVKRARELGLSEALVHCLAKSEDFEFGVYGQTPSASETQREISLNPGLIRKLERFDDHRHMRKWVGDDPTHRLLVCDIGLAVMLDSVTEAEMERMGVEAPHDFAGQKFLFDIGELRFKMRDRCKVGFVYPGRDERWGNIIRKTLAVVLPRLAHEVLWDLDDTRPSVTAELKKVGVTALSFADLCREYLSPELIENAGRLQSDLRAADKSTPRLGYIGARSRRKAIP